MSDDRYLQQFGQGAKPLKYQAQFYLYPQVLVSVNNDTLVRVNSRFEQLEQHTIEFGLKPEFSKCRFQGQLYNAEIGELIDSPQLYKVFKLGDGYYAQVLNFIVRLSPNPEEPVATLYQIQTLPTSMSEYTYGRVCKCDEERLVFSTPDELHTYSIATGVASKLELNIENKCDFMLFEYQQNIIAFDLNTNTVYSLVIADKRGTLTLVAESDGQQIIFQNKYLILTDGEEPKPNIEILDITQRKLYKCHQNWYQENFWLWLCIKDGQLEVNEDVEDVVNKLKKGETVSFEILNGGEEEEEDHSEETNESVKE